MSDKLKEYIDAHQHDEDYTPRAGHFERFKAKQAAQQKPVVPISQPKRVSMPTFMKVAASVVIIFGLGWFIFNLGRIQGAQEFGETAQSETNQEFYAELTQAETFFSAQIDKKKQELLAFSSSDNEATQGILNELRKLELQYIDLKEELALNANNAQVINAMIENYRLRLEVLERLLKQLRKQEQLKQKHHVEIQA